MKQIVDRAMLGTQGGASIPTPPAFAQELMEAVGGLSVERQLLLLAGAMKTCRLAGAVARSDVFAIEPPMAEERPVCSAKAAEVIRVLLLDPISEKSQMLLLEACSSMDRAQQRLPEWLLPLALDSKIDVLRKNLLPALGTTATWLAGMNPDWRWAIKEATSDVDDLAALKGQFDDARAAERAGILARARRGDPAVARNWLRETFSKEKPDQRVALIEGLKVNLGIDDMPFLESALKDRSSAVRGIAFDLLAATKDSRLALELKDHLQRIFARQDSEDSLLISVQWPDDATVRWAKAWLTAPKDASGGEMHFWLARLLGQFDPILWSQHWDLSPDEFLAALRTDWDETIWIGIAEASIVFGRSEFAAACFHRLRSAFDERRVSDIAVRSNLLRTLLDKMPLETASECVTSLVRSGKTAGFSWFQACAALKRPWSVDLGHALADRFAAALQQPPHSLEIVHEWLYVLAVAQLKLPYECMPMFLDASNEPKSHGQESSLWMEVVRQFLDTLRLRRKLHQELSA